MKKLTAVVLFASAVIMSACADPAANKPKAQTSEPSGIVANKTDSAPVVTNVFADFKAKGTELSVDGSASKIEFTGSNVTSSHDGGFKTFRGMIDLVGDKAEDSRVLFEIDMSSVFTDADGLTKHLQTGDFFDVAKYPKALFVSTRIVGDAAKGAGNYRDRRSRDPRGQKVSHVSGKDHAEPCRGGGRKRIFDKSKRFWHCVRR